MRPITTPHLLDDIAREEGFRGKAYPDPLSGAAPWTIGFGHTGPEVRPGLQWTREHARTVLEQDAARATAGLDRALPWWRALDDARQDVLVQMAFQMGVAGLLGFRRTLDLLRADRFAEAADQMLQSAWAGQTSARARRLAEQVRAGDRPADGALDARPT